MAMPAWSTTNALLGNGMQERPYNQHRVNVKAKFDDHGRGGLISNEETARRAIFAGASKPGTFDLLPWEGAFELEDRYNSSDDGFPRALTALNGIGDDELGRVLQSGDQQLLSMLITERLRYIGHPTKQWNSSIGKMNQSLGVQIQGVRPFWAFEAAPLNKLLQYRAPTMDESAEMIKNAPEGTSPGKVTLVAVPYDPADVSNTLKVYNTQFLANPAEFQKLLLAKYQRTTKVIRMLNKLHNFSLLSGISMIYALVRDGLIQLNIPNNAPLSPTSDNGILSVSDTANYLLSLSAKLLLLPNSNYPQIARNVNTEDVKSAFIQYRLTLLRSIFPADQAFYYFGFNKADGTVPGIDAFNRNLREGTAHGDMIKVIERSSLDAFSSVADFIYHSTRNVVGRVITPARKFGMGAFI